VSKASVKAAFGSVQYFFCFYTGIIYLGQRYHPVQLTSTQISFSTTTLQTPNHPGSSEQAAELKMLRSQLHVLVKSHWIYPNILFQIFAVPRSLSMLRRCRHSKSNLGHPYYLQSITEFHCCGHTSKPHRAPLRVCVVTAAKKK